MPEKSLSQFVKLLGPGVMMATAAVGGSHLVASTKAGAIYGWQLVGVILLVNLLKYPFFRAGIQFTMGTNQSLIQGYQQMGSGYLWLFTILNALSAVINSAALLLFSASLLGYFLPITLPLTGFAAIVLGLCLAILIAGHYSIGNSHVLFLCVNDDAELCHDSCLCNYAGFCLVELPPINESEVVRRIGTGL